MSAIVKTLGVSRTNISERLNGRDNTRPKQYFKSKDMELLKSIKALCSKRASYGYRRITALINREHMKDGQQLVNHKRIYRIMRDNNLLLTRYTGKSSRTHEGKVITLASNMRWSADTLNEIT